MNITRIKQQYLIDCKRTASADDDHANIIPRSTLNAFTVIRHYTVSGWRTSVTADNGASTVQHPTNPVH